MHTLNFPANLLTIDHDHPAQLGHLDKPDDHTYYTDHPVYYPDLVTIQMTIMTILMTSLIRLATILTIQQILEFTEWSICLSVCL